MQFTCVPFVHYTQPGSALQREERVGGGEKKGEPARKRKAWPGKQRGTFCAAAACHGGGQSEGPASAAF
jgi:hypothetical protein